MSAARGRGWTKSENSSLQSDPMSPSSLLPPEAAGGGGERPPEGEKEEQP